MADSNFYVIGKKGAGVLFIRTVPLRAALVPHQAILDYEALNPGVDGYAHVGAAARTWLATQDGNPNTHIDPNQAQGIETVLAGGATISEAEFTFVGAVSDGDWDLNRMSQMPIQAALKATGPSATGTDLTQAILSDTPK